MVVLVERSSMVAWKHNASSGFPCRFRSAICHCAQRFRDSGPWPLAAGLAGRPSIGQLLHAEITIVQFLSRASAYFMRHRTLSVVMAILLLGWLGGYAWSTCVHAEIREGMLWKDAQSALRSTVIVRWPIVRPTAWVDPDTGQQAPHGTFESVTLVRPDLWNN
jgi:hypothetical protein